MKARSRAGANDPELHNFPAAKCVDVWIKKKHKYAHSVTPSISDSPGLSKVLRRIRKRGTIQSSSSTSLNKIQRFLFLRRSLVPL